MLAEALKATPPENGQLNVSKLALNLEKVKITTPMGETSIRAEDHQVVLPIVVSKVTKDAKYKADDTAMGFEVVTQFAGPDAVNPLQKTCKMKIGRASCRERVCQYV